MAFIKTIFLVYIATFVAAVPLPSSRVPVPMIESRASNIDSQRMSFPLNKREDAYVDAHQKIDVADGFKLKMRDGVEDVKVSKVDIADGFKFHKRDVSTGDIDVGEGFRMRMRNEEDISETEHVDIADGFRVKMRDEDDHTETEHVDVADGFKA